MKREYYPASIDDFLSDDPEYVLLEALMEECTE